VVQARQDKARPAILRGGQQGARCLACRKSCGPGLQPTPTPTNSNQLQLQPTPTNSNYNSNQLQLTPTDSNQLQLQPTPTNSNSNQLQPAPTPTKFQLQPTPINSNQLQLQLHNQLQKTSTPTNSSLGLGLEMGAASADCRGARLLSTAEVLSRDQRKCPPSAASGLRLDLDMGIYEVRLPPIADARLLPQKSGPPKSLFSSWSLLGHSWRTKIGDGWCPAAAPSYRRGRQLLRWQSALPWDLLSERIVFGGPRVAIWQWVARSWQWERPVHGQVER
jgi:hypothetical protein